MARPARLVFLSLIIPACAPGQVSVSPAFEVASVKYATATQNAVDFRVYPSRVLITNLTLADIVREAYSVKIFQMSGGPGWLDSDRFNIEGKAAGEANRQELMAMLRALLADRFQLKTHREDRQGNAYELIVEMHGPKLRPSAADTSYLRLERNTPPELPGVSYTIRAQKTTLAQLADFLMGSLGGQVFNRTGITGEFDFSVNYAIDDHAEVGPSIFMALKEQLGLTLGPTKASITVLVIDSVERPQAN